MNYLQQYQQANRLNPDGIIGKKTCAQFLKEFKEIPNDLAFAHFIAQCRVESLEFTVGRENLNYFFSGLISMSLAMCDMFILRINEKLIKVSFGVSLLTMIIEIAVILLGEIFR